MTFCLILNSSMPIKEALTEARRTPAGLCSCNQNMKKLSGLSCGLSLLAITASLPSAYGAAIAPGDLVIYRVGDGVAGLTANAAAVFLDEYTVAGAFVQS